MLDGAKERRTHLARRPKVRLVKLPGVACPPSEACTATGLVEDFHRIKAQAEIKKAIRAKLPVHAHACSLRRKNGSKKNG
jgi:hypothetical protein